MVTAAAALDRRPSLTPWLAAALPPLVVGLLVVVNGWSGLMPGVGFWDTGEFQTVLPILGTAHPTGYPTYVLLGFVANLLLAPFGEPAFRINLLSLIAVGVAAGATVALVRTLTGSTAIGVAVGICLATTPLVWKYAMGADPHPIHLAFVAILFLTLVRWAEAGADEREAAATGANADRRRSDRRLLLAAVVFGLAAGNHSLTLLLVPPIGLYVLAVEPGIWRRWQFALACLAAAFITLAVVYLELPLRGGLIPSLTAPLVYAQPTTWDGFWYIALAEQFRGSLGDPFASLPGKVDELVTLANQQLGLLALALPPAFLVSAIRAPRYTLLSGLAFLITVLFDAAYANADIDRYYLGPVLWLWTWLGIFAGEVAALAGSLVGAVRERMRHAGTDARAPERAAALAALGLGLLLVLPSLGGLQERRQLVNRSGDRGAGEWLAQVLPLIADNAVLVSWWSTSTPLWYAQKVEGLRTDIEVIDDRTMLDRDLGRAPDVINRYLGERPVYVIRLPGRDTDELTAQFAMQPVAGGGFEVVWRVDGRLATAR